MLLAARRWVHCGPVVVAPRGQAVLTVECAGCRSTFAPAVLGESNGHVDDSLTICLRRGAARILATEDRLEPGHRRRAILELQRRAARPYRWHDLDDDIAAERLDPDEASRALEAAAARMNETGRHHLVDALARISVGEAGEVPPARRTALRDVATTIGIGAERIESAIGALAQQRRLAG